jgi:hypothetical protein
MVNALALQFHAGTSGFRSEVKRASQNSSSTVPTWDTMTEKFVAKRNKD